MSAQLTMKNRVNKEKRCSLDKCLSLWYNLSIEIENIFSVLFIAFDETLLTQLPRLSPPQNRVNSKAGCCPKMGQVFAERFLTKNNTVSLLAFSQLGCHRMACDQP